MMNNSVVALTEIDSEQLALVGGKALNLGRMLRAGLPVPTGFCVTTVAYQLVVGTRLDEVISELRSCAAEDRAQLAAKARQLVATAPLPDQLAVEIEAQYTSLGHQVPVAVRSSATAEDLPTASFAGQQDTFLNVVGVDNVLTATRRCWASLWTERAVNYRASQGIDPADVALAVVVQRLIDAEVAGVMFTANPVSGNRRQLVIDASPGLGESVVSGAVNPDRFTLDAESAAVIEQHLGDKRTAIRATTGGGTETEDLRLVASACLDRSQLDALAGLARQVAGVYDSPQDTEWAIDASNQAWLTQARPITTLYPQPPVRDGSERVYLCVSLAQGLTRPITPLGLAAFRLMGAGMAKIAGFPQPDPTAGPPGLVTIGNRLFAEITPLLRHRSARRVAIKVAGVMEARTQSVLNQLATDHRFAPKPDGSPGRTARSIIAPVMLKTRAPARLVLALLSPALARRATDRYERALRARWQLGSTMTPQQRLDLVEQRLGNDAFLVMPTVFPYAAAGLISLALAKRLAPTGLDQQLYADLRRGLPHNVTTEMDLELWRLSSRIGTDAAARSALLDNEPAWLAAAYTAGELPPIVQHGLAGFLDQYGHRAVAEIDLGMPRWSDQPEHLLGVLANYLRLDDPELAPTNQFARGAGVADRAAADIVAATRRQGALGPVRALLVAGLLRRARGLIGLRERPKSLFVYSLAQARRELWLVGAAAAAVGGIEQPDDTAYLDFGQLRAALAGIDQTPAVRRQRASYAAELGRRHIPRILLSDGTEPETLLRSDLPAGALVGSPASIGTVTGPARVVLDPAGAFLAPGEILVAPSTDPGWTPLFLTAGGLVMEMGGSMSHGAVVAREYGIPAVVGVPNATSKITTGQLITVDGAAGSVLINLTANS